MKLLFATQNNHKVAEIKHMTGGQHEIITLADLKYIAELNEPHHTLEENAIAKAAFVYQKFNTNCFAEDTGLEVETLNGEPGILSARYAGDQKDSEANIIKLLDKLNGKTNRRARFRTVIALMLNGKMFLFEGSTNGVISTEKRGHRGFGYDPVFIPDGFNKTFAEMSDSEKNAISHRGNAYSKMNLFMNSEFAQ